MYSDAHFENCLFQNNGELYFIVVRCVSGTPVFSRCTFLHNNAQTMYLDFTYAKVTNCLFHGNASPVFGGISYSTIELHGGMPALANCTVTGNSASAGTAAVLLSLEPYATIRNCILWGDAPQEILVAPGEGDYTQVSYSDIAGGWSGAGNISSNPLLVNVSGHDFSTASGSPCIDSGDNTAVPPGVIVDLPGNPRFVDDPATLDQGAGPPPIVDMGAYELQVVITLGDLNCDGVVGASDISPFVLALTDPTGYAQQYPGCSLFRGDLNEDGAVNGSDVARFVACLIGSGCP